MPAEEMSFGDAVEQELLRSEVWSESEQADQLEPAGRRWRPGAPSDLHTATIALSVLGLVAIATSLVMGTTLIFCLQRQFKGA